ncbi:MAG: hypothetical protein KKA65_02225 [Nanoarchaeota archaeon]|nr:hypothetical protein [Nanoarchaeota archaeon]MBU4456293.1 hypothetical protein [Nanoarchaeota archaeon]MCG2720143.1 hypothetical protein [Nanoarchaeota archaeon]
MKTRYVIGIFVVALFVVTIAITQINPDVTGDAIEVQASNPGFFAKLFGIKKAVNEQVQAELIEETQQAEQMGNALINENCRAVKVENSQLNGDNICSNTGKNCQWIFAERTRTYYETELEGSQINCEGKIQAVMKEYSFSAIACSGISTGFNSESCSRMTTVASDEPRLGDVKVSEYQPFEVMCC